MADQAKGPSLIVVLLNLIVLVITIGFLVYSRFYYKRPPITDEGERKQLTEQHSKPTNPSAPAYIQFTPQVINISAIPNVPKSADGTFTQLQGKLHYVTIGFSLEIRDPDQVDTVEGLRPYIQDKLLSLLGRKQFSELNTLEGRYILRSQLLDLVNGVVSSHSPTPVKDDLVTNLYFTDFTVQ